MAPLDVLLPIVGAAIAGGNFILAFTKQAGNLATKRKTAAAIKQIDEVAEHSNKDSAKKHLQQQRDALVLRYTALRVIKLSRRDKVSITLAWLLTAFFFVALFYIQSLLPTSMPSWATGLLAVIWVSAPQFMMMAGLIRFETLKVNRDLFILLDAPPLDRFHKYPPPNLRDYYLRPTVRGKAFMN